jgi:hypothetical protein
MNIKIILSMKNARCHRVAIYTLFNSTLVEPFVHAGFNGRHKILHPSAGRRHPCFLPPIFTTSAMHPQHDIKYSAPCLLELAHMGYAKAPQQQPYTSSRLPTLSHNSPF